MAARAGVSTATLYRRWSSKDDLVIAAAADYHETLDTQSDSGSLEGDLRAVLRAKAATLTGEGGRLMQALIGEATQNTALAEAPHRRLPHTGAPTGGGGGTAGGRPR
ncbi:TetR/AcrR family transcriptional regulator C-terminal ligand-binding domain-containing protein [Streptomyces griseofuscus]|uniref:TetR/AcrR family transcriptional regulator n=1 Tax=Streptomyces griseofuscus TaxID=146922 RepID=UPI00380AAD21